MALKTRFSDKEKYGFTDDELKQGLKTLRRSKTAGAIEPNEAQKLYELIMMGYSTFEVHQQYPQYPVGQIVLTAALRGWMHDREKINSSLKDRIQAKIVKSVVEQVDFLTTMLSVTNTENIEGMRSYILDPKNNPKPDVRIQSIKEYKDIAETLQKLIAATMTQPAEKKKPAFDVMNAKVPKLEEAPSKKKPKEKEVDLADLIADEEEFDA